jgi:peptidylprolyl isomerase
MAEAANGNIVKVHYTGKLADGTVFDSSREGDPLEFTIGDGSLIPGFEAAVIGMQPGENKSVQIPSDQAYGPFFEEMVQQISRDKFPKEMEIELGGQVMAQQPDGEKLVLTIVEITDESVTVDANHPLAGHDLEFEIEVVSVG